MKILICDDDKSIHGEINKLLNSDSESSTFFNIESVYSAEQMIEKYNRNEFFDIIFLDIEMSSMSGIEAAKIIRKMHSDAIIIFISNHPHYVFEAFNVEALHFLTKPIAAFEFKNVLNRAVNKYKKANSTIALKWQGERYIIKIDSIKYIEGYQRHIMVHTAEGVYEAIGKVSDLFNVLSVHGFIRTHQGFVVNMDCIQRFDPMDVILFDGTKIMLSVRKRAEALQVFDNYLKSRKW